MSRERQERQAMSNIELEKMETVQFEMLLLQLTFFNSELEQFCMKRTRYKFI